MYRVPHGVWVWSRRNDSANRHLSLWYANERLPSYPVASLSSAFKEEKSEFTLFTLKLRTNVHTRFGRPVPVGPANPEPSDERVEEVFVRYLAELRSLEKWKRDERDETSQTVFSYSLVQTFTDVRSAI